MKVISICLLLIAVVYATGVELDDLDAEDLLFFNEYDNDDDSEEAGIEESADGSAMSYAQDPNQPTPPPAGGQPDPAQPDPAQPDPAQPDPADPQQPEQPEQQENEDEEEKGPYTTTPPELKNKPTVAIPEAVLNVSPKFNPVIYQVHLQGSGCYSDFAAEFMIIKSVRQADRAYERLKACLLPKCKGIGQCDQPLDICAKQAGGDLTKQYECWYNWWSCTLKVCQPNMKK